jgi:putative endonuclease
VYSVYILSCADGTLYTGITTDVARRFAEHTGSGGRGAKYTRAHTAVRIEAVWSAADRASASRLEARIKSLPRGEKLALIRSEAVADVDLSAYTRLPVPPPAAEKEGA